jgi:hypothetical protein
VAGDGSEITAPGCGQTRPATLRFGGPRFGGPRERSQSRRYADRLLAAARSCRPGHDVGSDQTEAEKDQRHEAEQNQDHGQRRQTGVVGAHRSRRDGPAQTPASSAACDARRVRGRPLARDGRRRRARLRRSRGCRPPRDADDVADPSPRTAPYGSLHGCARRHERVRANDGGSRHLVQEDRPDHAERDHHECDRRQATTPSSDHAITPRRAYTTRAPSQPCRSRKS